VRPKIGPSKKLAERVLHKLMIGVVENKYLDVRKKTKVKFETLVEQYLSYAKANKRSGDKDQRNLNCLSRCFAGKYLYEITPYQIENYKIDRIKALFPLPRLTGNLHV
jgi:hypothetical protein